MRRVNARSAGRERAGPTEQVRAVLVKAPGTGVGLTRLSRPVPGPGEAVVRSVAVGICGSDMDLIEGARPEGFARYPVVPGHEWSGIVVEVGPGVRSVRPGQPVVAEGLLRCGRCRACHAGRVALCREGYDELGFTRPGGTAELVLVPEEQLHVLPPGVDLVDAALVEPTAVVVHAFLRVPSLRDVRVVVVGDGPLGLLAIQAARALGASHVGLVGLDTRRMQLARQLGADDVVEARQLNEAAHDRWEADVVVECAGGASAAPTAIGLARAGGTVALVGVTGPDATLRLAADDFVVRDLTVTGVLASTPASWSSALDLISSRRIRLGALVSHRFPLAAAVEAYATAAARAPGTGKVLIVHEGQGQS